MVFPPSTTAPPLSLTAISGISGSVSIACWVVVFTPQILSNFRRSSAKGLSVAFIIVWLAGDVFNILGAVLQGVLPTMIILAVYYTAADVVLLAQCWYYEGFALTDGPQLREAEANARPTGAADAERHSTVAIAVASDDDDEAASISSEDRPLLARSTTGQASSSYGTSGSHAPPDSPRRPRPYHHHHPTLSPARITDIEPNRRRSSASSFADRLRALDGTHLSPVTPLVPQEPPAPVPAPLSAADKDTGGWWGWVLNAGAVAMVCAAGVLGWWLSNSGGLEDSEEGEEVLRFNMLGQVFGYVCAVLYLGSRLPQLLLNYRRKSTEGISMLFFLFACIGNMTYVLSILAYDPARHCPHPHREMPAPVARCDTAAVYGRYVLVNASWLLGSFGTLLLDAGVFVQYFLYRDYEEDRGRRGRKVKVSNGSGAAGHEETARR